MNQEEPAIKKIQRRYIREYKEIPYMIDNDNNLHKELYIYYQMCLKLLSHLITDQILGKIKLKDISIKLNATINDMIEMDVNISIQLMEILTIKMNEYRDQLVYEECFEAASNIKRFEEIYNQILKNE